MYNECLSLDEQFKDALSNEEIEEYRKRKGI